MMRPRNMPGRKPPEGASVSTFGGIFISARGDLKARIVLLYTLLLVLNAGAWGWAILSFRHMPALLGISLLVYGLGLRHAVDADHIAAIDNVTRKLMQDGQRPVAVGFWFAMGHSAIVVLVATLVMGATSLLGRFESLRAIGGTISTSVSAIFLFAIATMNIIIFCSIYKSYQRVRSGGTYDEENIDLLLSGRSLLSRMLRPLFRLVARSSHMFMLGLLFGLGFDTATEIAMFSMSARQVSEGVPFGAILALPALFAAGMALVDTTDGVVMLGAYEWAFVKPIRKLYYNMTITLISVCIAILIGGIETLGLIGNKFELNGAPWRWVAELNSNFNNLGFAVIGVFVFAWMLSYIVYRARRLDDLVVDIPVRQSWDFLE